MFSSIQRSLNVLYGAPVRRNFIFERFFAVVIAMAAILIVFAVSIVFIFGEQVLRLVAEFFSLNLASIILDLSFVKWGLLFGTVFLLMSFMYYSIPNVKWSFLYAFPGGLFTTIGFVLISQLFSIYIHYAGRNFTANGAFGTLIVFMIWLYFIANVMILGGVLNVIVYRFGHHKQDTEGVTDEKKNLMYDDKDSRIDYGVILPVLLLAFISIATLFSTTYLISGNTSLRMVLMQVVWYVVGLSQSL